MRFYEKHRPRRWADVAGHDEAIRRIARLADQGIGGNAFWLSGPSGVGKTSIARLIAREVADPLNIEELDAHDLTAERLRDIRESMHMYGLGASSGRAWIVNEAHGLRKPIVRSLLTLLEELPEHCVFAFTTTNEGQLALLDGIDADPLLSRCVPLELEPDIGAFAVHVRFIALAEGLDGKRLHDYIQLAETHSGNMRKMLEAVAAGKME